MTPPPKFYSLCFAAILLSPAVVRAAAGARDATFFGSRDGSVFSTSVQGDGKIVVGGIFQNSLARLHATGALDAGFTGRTNGEVYATAIQPNGQIVVGGVFNFVGLTNRDNLARLHPDGTTDLTFGPIVNNQVNCMALQKDGKILIGGSFNAVNEAGRNGIARLHPDGTLDLSFNPDVEGTVYSIVILADGRIMVAGNFAAVGGETRSNIARLTPAGLLDPSFTTEVNSRVFCTALQADGSILLGGAFTFAGDASRNRLARFLPDGTLDATFNPDADQAVRTITVQTDGKIVIGGYFTTIGHIVCNNIARLNPDGTRDMAFEPNADDRVWSTALQADGKVIVGGDFTSIGGGSAYYLARLENDPATQSLSARYNSRIEWLRGGASPEAFDATFHISTDDGSTWTPLGYGSRIPGGWELRGLTLPAPCLIRGRGLTGGGQYSGSTGLVNTVTAIPFFPPLTPLESWRKTNFGNAENAGPGADTADPDKDGLNNLTEFALGLNPATDSRASLPVWQKEGSNLVTRFPRASELGDVSMVAEWSTSLLENSWSSVSNSGNSSQHVFSVSTLGRSRMFLKLTVSRP